MKYKPMPAPKLSPGMSRLYKSLKQLRSSTRPDLAVETGLSLPAVGTIVDALAECGLVTLKDPEANGRRGRPAQEVSTCPELHTVAAVDFSGPYLQHGTFDLYGNLISEAQGAYTLNAFGMSPEQIVDFIATQLENYPQAKALGVSFPGIVQNGVILKSWLIPSGEPFDMQSALEDRLGRPTLVENDVKASAWGEFKIRKLKQSRTLMFLSFGQGYGAGLVVNGRLFRGAHGSAGELALLPISADIFLHGETRSDDQQFPKIPDLSKNIISAPPSGPAFIGELAFSTLYGLGLDMIDPIADLISRVNALDEKALTAFDTFTRYLALMIASGSAALDPDLVVLQNVWPEAEGLFLNAIERHLRTHIKVNLTVSQTGRLAGLHGIAIAAAETLERRLLQGHNVRGQAQVNTALEEETSRQSPGEPGPIEQNPDENPLEVTTQELVD